MKQKEKLTKNHMDKYSIWIILLLSFFVIVIFGMFLFMRSQRKGASENTVTYNTHYAFISKSKDSYITNRVYEEALTYGRQRQIYVEKMDTDIGGSLTDADYVKMAAAMQVDGIILEGSEDGGLQEAVSEARLKEIPVITILSDVGSKRNCYIETGDYNQGRDYGRAIISETDTRQPQVVVLINHGIEKDYREFLSGLEETLHNEGNHLSVTIEQEDITDLPNFRLMDHVREMLTQDNAPDILLCVNEHDTQIVNQTLLDYAVDTETQIIGNGISESLLKSVKDGRIEALVDVDSAQMGMLCVDTLQSIRSGNTVTTHAFAEETVVTDENVARYLHEE